MTKKLVDNFLSLFTIRLDMSPEKLSFPRRGCSHCAILDRKVGHPDRGVNFR